MATLATKFQTGAAAAAIAAAAVITPAAIAQADEAGISAESARLATSAVLALGYTGEGNSRAAAAADADTPYRTIIQNEFLWFGPANPNSPSPAASFTFDPYGVPYFRPFVGWLQNLNFEACVLGASVKFGPYGSVTGSLARSC